MAKRPNVLLVEPDSHDLQMLEISLRNMGFSVTTATNGFDAIKKIEIFPPELIISELRADDFDGYAFCKEVKESEKWASIPFIFLSSEKEIQSKVKALQLGVDDYLTKPIFLVELVARIKMLLQKKQRESIEKRESRTRFTGSIAEIGLVDIMQTIDLSKKQGVVHLAHGEETGAMYFIDGAVIDAELGQIEGEEAVYRMMRWKDGFFDIEFRPIRREKKIDRSMSQLIMEGLKRVDEWNKILEQLPPMDTIFEVDVAELVERLDEIPDEVNELLALFDGKRNLEEILTSEIFSDLDTLRIISKLIFFGVLIESAPGRAGGEEIAVGEVEKGVSFERTDTQKFIAPFTARDIQFGKAEDVKMGMEQKGRQEDVGAAEVEREEEVSAGEESRVIGKVDVKKIPVQVVSGEKAIEEQRGITVQKEYVRGEEIKEAKEKKLQQLTHEVIKREETIKVKAAQVSFPSVKEKEKEEEMVKERETGEKKEERILSAIDSKIKRMKEEKKIKEEAVVEEVPKVEKEAKTAKMFVEEREGEREKEKVAVEEKIAAGAEDKRWTFPAVEGTSTDEVAKAGMEVERKVVQSISLQEVKEEIERKKAEESAELSDSGVYGTEAKEFFSSAPEGAEPVDTFEDLIGKKEEKGRGKRVRYVWFTTIFLVIAGGLFVVLGKDYFKAGPDMKLLEKLEKAEAVEVKPLKKQSPKPVHVVKEEMEEIKEGKRGEGKSKRGSSTEAKAGMKAEESAGEKIEEQKKPPDVFQRYQTLIAEAQELIKSRKKRQAIKKYKEAVEINPDGIEALVALIDYYKERPSVPGVLEWGKRAVTLAPDDSKALFAYGVALYTAGKKTEAREIFTRCVNLKSNSSVRKCNEMLKWIK